MVSKHVRNQDSYAKYTGFTIPILDYVEELLNLSITQICSKIKGSCKHIHEMI